VYFQEDWKKYYQAILLQYTPIGYIMRSEKEGYSSVLYKEDKMNNTDKCSCQCKKKVRDDKELKDLTNRLSRIEGQVRGIKRMVEEDAYCVDILNQVAAVNAALNSFNKVLLANHIKSCVVENVRRGNQEIIDELVATMEKLMR